MVAYICCLLTPFRLLRTSLWAVDTTNTNKLISECIDNKENNEIHDRSNNHNYKAINNNTMLCIDNVKLASFGVLINEKYMKLLPLIFRVVVVVVVAALW